MDKKIVLLIEDNIKLNEINTRALETEGYIVDSVNTLYQARKIYLTKEIGVILLDINMPDGDGIKFCKEIRNKTDAYIIFLTSSTDHENKIKGLEVGGDDYITKPYKIDEMLMRVKVAFRRINSLKDSSMNVIIEKENFKFNKISLKVFINGEDIFLTPKEFSVLLLLVENINKTLTAEYIYESVWKVSKIEDKNALQAIISKLRKKLKPKKYNIKYIIEKGYLLIKENNLY